MTQCEPGESEKSAYPTLLVFQSTTGCLLSGKEKVFPFFFSLFFFSCSFSSSTSSCRSAFSFVAICFLPAAKKRNIESRQFSRLLLSCTGSEGSLISIAWLVYPWGWCTCAHHFFSYPSYLLFLRKRGCSAVDCVCHSYQVVSLMWKRREERGNNRIEEVHEEETQKTYVCWSLVKDRCLSARFKERAWILLLRSTEEL